MRLDRIAAELAKTYFVGGSSIATDIPGGVASFAKVNPGATVPDVQLLLAGAPLTAGPYLKPFTQPFDDGFGGRIVMLHPESRGELLLASADPARRSASSRTSCRPTANGRRCALVCG